jgi:hypothetical protein
MRRSHVLISRRTVVTNQGYVPQPFTVADYRARVAALSVRARAAGEGPTS